MVATLRDCSAYFNIVLSAYSEIQKKIVAIITINSYYI